MEKDNNEIQVFSSVNEYEIDLVCGLLKESDIPFIKKDEGAGSYLNISMGDVLKEKRVYVGREDYDKSLQLISEIILNESDIPDELKEDKKDLEIEKKRMNNSKWLKRGVVIFSFGLTLLAIILIIIASIINNPNKESESDIIDGIRVETVYSKDDN